MRITKVTTVLLLAVALLFGLLQACSDKQAVKPLDNAASNAGLQSTASSTQKSKTSKAQREGQDTTTTVTSQEPLSGNVEYYDKMLQSPDYQHYSASAFGTLNLTNAVLYHTNRPHVKAITVPIQTSDGYRRVLVSFFNITDPNEMEMVVLAANTNSEHTGYAVGSLTTGEMLSQYRISNGRVIDTQTGTASRRIGFYECLMYVNAVCDSTWWCSAACYLDQGACVITFYVSCAAVALYPYP